MKRTLYVIASSPETAESIAFLSRNNPDGHELSASTPEDAAESLAQMRAERRHWRSEWLDTASVYEVSLTITAVVAD